MKRSTNKPAVVFRPGDDWQNNARVWRTMDAYITGYRRAGELLVSHVVDNTMDQDTLLYPIVYVYRHALELLLKEVISSGRMLLNEKSSVGPTGHDLEKLWPIALGVLDKIWPNADDRTEIELITQVVKELSEHDRRSDAFRYPASTKDQPHLTELGLINLRHFGEQLETCCGLLDGAVTGIHEYIELSASARYDSGI